MLAPSPERFYLTWLSDKYMEFPAKVDHLLFAQWNWCATDICRVGMWEKIFGKRVQTCLLSCGLAGDVTPKIRKFVPTQRLCLVWISSTCALCSCALPGHFKICYTNKPNWMFYWTTRQHKVTPIWCTKNLIKWIKKELFRALSASHKQIFIEVAAT